MAAQTLDETIIIRMSGITIPLIDRGAQIATTKRETLTTTRDDQESIRCELVTTGEWPRSLAQLEVGVRRAPRGVPRAQLVLRLDADGSAYAELTAEHGMAQASFAVAIQVISGSDSPRAGSRGQRVR